MHPMAFAAWFGLLATALNLFPDRSARRRTHLVRGPRPAVVARHAGDDVAVAIVLAYFFTSWIVWTSLMVVMLFMFGRHHPRTFDEHVPLDRTASACSALVAVVMFVLCFTPAPIEPMDSLRG